LNYALSDKTNKTKFKLLFSNVTEADILLREEIDVLKKKYPDTFDVVYILDKADDKWKGELGISCVSVILWLTCVIGPTGYINAGIIKQHIAPASLNEKVKIFVCGACSFVHNVQSTIR
jgi:cytochrome-b5 reductase